MTFDQFLVTYNGQRNVGNTPENKGQCVGLVAVWVDNLGLPHIWGDAKDLYANADPNSFDKIPNSPTAIPQKGDIIVWSAKYNNGAGHTGLSTGSGDTNKFEAFVQNDPVGSNCHLKTYSSYFAVVGWLRPKITPPNQSSALTVCLAQHDQLVKEAIQLKATITMLTNKLNQIRDITNG